MDLDLSNSDTVVDRFYAALGRGDIVAARACFTPNAQIWHNYDAVQMSLDDAVASWEQLAAASQRSAISDVRRTATPDGFVQRHAWTMTTLSGATLIWAICLFVRLDGDKIARMDEYIDRAGKLAVTGDPILVPGMD